MPDRIVRLFVAIFPPEETRRAMLRAFHKLSPPPDARHRVTPLEQLHMTLQFIGDSPESELESVTESVERSAAGVGPFSLVPIRLITLPERGMPRLIAMETDAPPQLLEMHRRLAQRLARSPRAKAGDGFLPHLTVCRFTASARPQPLDHPVSLEPFPIAVISLMQSILRSEGAIHSVVSSISLA
jgi:2'-5' RNA ligase